MANFDTDLAATLAAASRGRANCSRLYLMVQEVLASSSQAAIDLIVSTAADSNLVPKPTSSLDGQSYQWDAYSVSLLNQIDRLTDLINKLSAPWEIRAVGRA